MVVWVIPFSSPSDYNDLVTDNWIKVPLHYTRTPRKCLSTCASKSKWIGSQRGTVDSGELVNLFHLHLPWVEKRDLESTQVDRYSRKTENLWRSSQPDRRTWHYQSGTEVSSQAEDREEHTEAASLSRATVERSGLWETRGATTLAEEVISERSDILPSCMWVSAGEACFSPAIQEF